jgi:carbonic anhydrase/acetyltransferase-like protein (isoleucine patch superfamily)
MDGATIGKNAIVDAGALVTEGKKIPSGVLIMEFPGKL